MIAGPEAITAGTIAIGGRVVNDLAPKARDIAMVFQSYALYLHMTVAENMTYSLRLKRTPKATVAEKLGAASAKLGLDAFLARKPKALSGGQRQRVAMGRAIVRAPKAFLDEPLSNLDARLREQMRAEILQAPRRPRRDLDLRHPRPSRGDDARRPHRRHARRHHPAGGLPRPLRPAGQPLRRRFIGSPGMNFLPGTGTPARRPSASPTAPSSPTAVPRRCPTAAR